MKYMLDTNVCIHLIKKRPPEVIARFMQHGTEEFCVSSITYAELMHGVEKSSNPIRNRIAVTMLLSSIAVLPFDDRAAQAYGAVRVGLQKMGTPIGPMDTLIAAHAVSRGLTLITNNIREFIRVNGLSVEDWVN